MKLTRDEKVEALKSVRLLRKAASNLARIANRLYDQVRIHDNLSGLGYMYPHLPNCNRWATALRVQYATMKKGRSIETPLFKVKLDPTIPKGCIGLTEAGGRVRLFRISGETVADLGLVSKVKL